MGGTTTGATTDCLPLSANMEDNNAATGNDQGNATASGINGGDADAGTSSIILVASNAPGHDNDANNNYGDNDNAAGKKDSVSAVAGGLVALVAIALLAVFFYGRCCYCSSKHNHGGRGKDLAKAVPVLTLVNDDVKNLCNGGRNDDGNAYHKILLWCGQLQHHWWQCWW